jgi:hypothetical protein
MMCPALILVTHFTPKIKLITFLNERDKVSPVTFEGQVTTHVTVGVRRIETLPWHDGNIVNTILLHKTLQ